MVSSEKKWLNTGLNSNDKVTGKNKGAFWGKLCSASQGIRRKRSMNAHCISRPNAYFGYDASV
jgi:hypothetical protein